MSFRRRRGQRLQVQRQHGRLLGYQGDRARVVFSDGRVRAVPAAPFRSAELGATGWFVLITYRRPGGELVQVQVRRIAEPRGSTPRSTTPLVYVKRGRAVTTRR